MPFKAMFATALTDTWTTAADGDPVGDIRWESNKAYKCVLFDFDGSVSCAANEVAVYTDDSGYEAHTVNVNTTGQGTNAIGAGVCMAAATAASVFMWIQIKGVATLQNVVSGGGDGSMATCHGAADGDMKLVDGDAEHMCAIDIDTSAGIVICDFPF